MYFWKKGRKLWKDINSLQALQFIGKSVYLRTTGTGYQQREGRRAEQEAASQSWTWPCRHRCSTRADESCQSALTALLLLQAGGVSPPLIPPGTHRWKLLMASLWRRAWLGCNSRTPGGGVVVCGAISAGSNSFEGVTWGGSRKRVEGGGLGGVGTRCYARRTLVTAALVSAEEVLKRPLSCLALAKSTWTWMRV